MTNRITRRSALQNLAIGTAATTAAALSLGRQAVAADKPASAKLKGRINHSVCRWCYGSIPLEKLCQEAAAMGIKSIELVGPKDWPILKKYGLTCAMPNGADMGCSRGFSQVKYHDKLVADYEVLISKAAAAGLKNVICLSGNREGLDDEAGLKNCVKGLKRIMKTAEKNNITVVMELLNSKVDHKDYLCDHTEFGVKLCKAVGSENMKLLYDIYHMQIMEGDLIRTIKNNAPYIAHYHTGGNPGRAEIDETQEIYYPPIMKAIVATGYKGFVAHEFMPKSKDPLSSLRAAVQICDV